MIFTELNIIEPILSALKTEGYTKPTPIQEKAIPVVLQNKDLLACAQTGTGKTAAFAIPILQLLHTRRATQKGKRIIQSMILTPTRELAIQIGESFAAYGRFTGLKYTVIFGGVPQKAQTIDLQHGTDIVIATPGRLLDLIRQGFVDLRNLSVFVLDEADRMLDMGFLPDIKKILTFLPARRQSLFFSATLPPDIVKLSATIQKDPFFIEITPELKTAETVQQFLYHVDKADKNSLLVHLLQGDAINTVLVFTRTKYGADKVAKHLIRNNIMAESIHGNKSQHARQRALHNFKNRQTRVLVATDIASRGIDVDNLSHVINYDIP